MGRLLTLLRKKGAEWVVDEYDALDLFTTDEAAPITSPRTMEPGPGTLTIVDTNDQMPVEDAGIMLDLRKTDISNPAAGDRIVGALVPRTAGSAWFAGITNRTNWSSTQISLASTVDTTADGEGYRMNSGTTNQLFIATMNLRPVQDMGPDHLDFGVVMRAAGSFLLRRSGFSGDFTLDAVSYAETGGAYPRFRCRSANRQGMKVQNWRQFNLAAYDPRFATEWGLATARAATPEAGETLTGSGDAIVEFTWTAATGETLELDVRRTDADNRVIVRCIQADSVIRIIQRVAGVETQLASAAQTWTNGTTYRLGITMDGDMLATHTSSGASGANVNKSVVYTGTFNQEATGVRVSHAGANLVVWPRRVSLPGMWTTASLAKAPRVEPFLTFVDDDSSIETYDRLFPLFESKGIKGVSAVITDSIATGGGEGQYWAAGESATTANLLEMQAAGWEIASHTHTHRNLDTVYASDPEDAEYELTHSLSVLTAAGFDVQNFVAPFSAAGQSTVRPLIAKHYRAHCQSAGRNKYFFHDFLLDSSTTLYGRTRYRLGRRGLGSFAPDLTLAEYKAYVDQTVSERLWGIFMLHAFGAEMTEDQWGWLEDTIDYAQGLGLPILTLREVLDYYRVSPDPSLAP